MIFQETVSPAVSTILEKRNLVCPSCQSPLTQSGNYLVCESESLRFTKTSGIHDFLLPGRREEIESFLNPYEDLRNKEGWSIGSRSEYELLPHAKRGVNRYQTWQLRSRSYDRLAEDLRSHSDSPLRIVDLGAGNGWLSYKLALQGHSVTSVDASIGSDDGLGAAMKFFDQIPPFLPVRAEYDFLPFENESFDVGIFNASLHYSPNPVRTLISVRRILKENGLVYVMDSPFFRNETDGQMMITETMDRYKRQFGINVSDRGVGYLKSSLAEELDGHYDVRLVTSGFGVAWKLTRFFKRLLLKRELADFPILSLRKRSATQS